MLQSWLPWIGGMKYGILALAIWAALGCKPEPVVSRAGESKPSDAADREYWDAIYFADKKVGYVHTVYAPIRENGRELLRITAESELSIQRFSELTRQRLRSTSIETPSGEVVRFESSMSSGDSGEAEVSLEATGKVDGDQLQLKLTTLGKTQAATLPWKKEWGGYFAMDQSLERQPLQPGEKRQLRAILPGFNQIADVEFVAGPYELTDMLDGKRELLRIETKITLGANVLEQTVWTARDGQTMKTFMPALKQVTYRTSQETAVAKGTGTFDLGETTVVKIERPLEDPHRTRRVVYRATLTTGDPRKYFVQGATQLIRPVDEHTIEIVVRSLRPADESGTAFSADEPPTPEDLAPNSLIQSDNEQVLKVANEIAANKTSPWEIAVALEWRVQEMIDNKNFSQALSSAAEVLRSGEGDCTEHAVLLAALCRARKIPARVAIGLVYYRPANGFAYHMWTEAWVGDRWIPLDATLGQGGIGAAHLTVSRSNLKGVDPLTQFLPVLQLMGNLELEVLEAE
jgi:transglutaminase-like putative cysteine protease